MAGCSNGFVLFKYRSREQLIRDHESKSRAFGAAARWGIPRPLGQHKAPSVKRLTPLLRTPSGAYISELHSCSFAS